MKKRSIFTRFNNWFIFSLMTLVVVAIVIASTMVINYLLKEEIKRVDILVSAMKFQQEEITPSLQVQELLLNIYSSNNTIPVIILDGNDQIIVYKNLSDDVGDDAQKIVLLAKRMAKNYPPIELKFSNGNNQFVYYDNSVILNNLRYSPFLLGFIVLCYFLFSFWFLRTVKKTDEGYLWAGLAKETAHQIGTPLSSMIGWIEIMKLENPDSDGISEMEKDIERLKTISERFSKIGSIPELNDMNFNHTITENYNYLKTRISKKIEFTLSLPNYLILLPHNRILLSWVIENLVKNAVDAMKGVGSLQMSVFERNKNILIEVKDSGSGMTKYQAQNAFKPGYSTKKRGWGLGLSLAQRVVQEYHSGDIKISQTEIGKGTTFRIIIRKKDSDSK